MVYGGANICLTDILSLLIDVVDIPPLPISVAVAGSDVTMDHCCTNRSLLPIMLADGSLYYQSCYYCKNAVKSIISPLAILDGSGIFVEWTQTGYKDNSPSLLRFSSASGLASMSIVLKKRDGLYYTHPDVYTVDKDTVHPCTPLFDASSTPNYLVLIAPFCNMCRSLKQVKQNQNYGWCN